QEAVTVLDAATGKQVWSVTIGKVGPNPKETNYPGPRSTPTVERDVLYTLGSDGDLVCLEIAGGKERWKKNLKTEFRGKVGQWGDGESPLVDGDLVICTPGGKESTLAALNKNTGETVWKCAVPPADAKDELDSGYASAIAGDASGVRQYVQFLGKGLVGV